MGEWKCSWLPSGNQTWLAGESFFSMAMILSVFHGPKAWHSADVERLQAVARLRQKGRAFQHLHLDLLLFFVGKLIKRVSL
jgi:hypothetical protein